MGQSILLAVEGETDLLASPTVGFPSRNPVIIWGTEAMSLGIYLGFVSAIPVPIPMDAGWCTTNAIRRVPWRMPGSARSATATATSRAARNSRAACRATSQRCRKDRHRNQSKGFHSTSLAEAAPT